MVLEVFLKALPPSEKKDIALIENYLSEYKFMTLSKGILRKGVNYPDFMYICRMAAEAIEQFCRHVGVGNPPDSLLHDGATDVADEAKLPATQSGRMYYPEAEHRLDSKKPKGKKPREYIVVPGSEEFERKREFIFSDLFGTLQRCGVSQKAVGGIIIRFVDFYTLLLGSSLNFSRPSVTVLEYWIYR